MQCEISPGVRQNCRYRFGELGIRVPSREEPTIAVGAGKVRVHTAVIGIDDGIRVQDSAVEFVIHRPITLHIHYATDVIGGTVGVVDRSGHEHGQHRYGHHYDDRQQTLGG